MSDNIIDFAKSKSDADKSRSHHFVSLDVYLNADNSEVWASVANVDQQDIDASWHTFVADLLRKLAWLSDSMAANIGGEDGKPVASISVFEGSRISTRWASDLIITAEQVDWVRNQMISGVDEIEAELTGAKDRDRVTVIREFRDRNEALVYRDWNAESLAEDENARIQGPIKVDGLWRVTIKRVIKEQDQ